jgi:hypothetical protein
MEMMYNEKRLTYTDQRLGGGGVEMDMSLTAGIVVGGHGFAVDVYIYAIYISLLIVQSANQKG